MLFFKKIFGNLTIDDLPQRHIPEAKLRKEAQILIIEDQDFDYEQGLRAAGFNLTINKRWQNVNDVVPYSIIVSDNNGVVLNAPNSDGLTMITEAKKLFPEKRYVLYSGNMMDIRDRNVEDIAIRTKGDRLDIWISMLEDAISELYTPSKAWKQISRILDTQSISEKERRKLQHNFVLSIINNRENIESKKWSISKDTLSLIVRITSLVVSTGRLLTSI